VEIDEDINAISTHLIESRSEKNNFHEGGADDFQLNENIAEESVNIYCIIELPARKKFIIWDI